jgi:MYXO-CTERM domain-containing protein
MRWFTTLVLALAIGWSGAAAADSASSISQYGITWTFEGPHEVGQFASGDYWVVGPVTIQSVSPAPTGTRNGSCVNPMGGRQGYDDRGGEYDTTDCVSIPYTLAVDESLVSSVSKPEGGDFLNVGCLQSQAVLTAVGAPPAAGTLRPPYAGTYKRSPSTTQIQWSLLPNLPAPSTKPDGAQLLLQAERPRIDHLSSWTIQFSCAQDNWNNGPGAHACYGREYSTFISQAAQYVMLDTPERDELVISLIQHGIDNFGVIRAGGDFAPNGGHHSGRKWPIVFAARLLDDCDMLRVGLDYDADTFGEDGQTYFGTNGEALFGWDCGGGHGSYFENGCSGSGAKDCRDPAGLVDGCEDYRNCCTSAYWVGQMLATLMLHAETIWSHDAYFAYVDRWMNGAVAGGGSADDAFVGAMWSLYRTSLPPGSAASTTCGGPGDGGVDDAGSGGGDAGSGDAASSSADGGAGRDASSGGASDAGDTAARDDVTGGCGCRTAPTAPAPGWLWLAALAVGLARKRPTDRERAR